MFRGFEKETTPAQPSAEVINLATFRRRRAKADRKPLPAEVAADHGWYHQAEIESEQRGRVPTNPS